MDIEACLLIGISGRVWQIIAGIIRLYNNFNRQYDIKRLYHFTNDHKISLNVHTIFVHMTASIVHTTMLVVQILKYLCHNFKQLYGDRRCPNNVHQPYIILKCPYNNL